MSQLPAHPKGEIATRTDSLDVESELLDRIQRELPWLLQRGERRETISQVAAPVQEGDQSGEIIVELGGVL